MNRKRTSENKLLEYDKLVSGIALEVLSESRIERLKRTVPTEQDKPNAFLESLSLKKKEQEKSLERLANMIIYLEDRYNLGF